MRSFHWTLLFALIIAALVAFTVFDTKRTEKIETKKEQDLNVLRIEPDLVTKFEIIPRGGQSLVVEKKGEDWFLLSPIQEPADNQEAKNFLISIKAERTIETVAEGSEANPKTYGLDAPPYEVRLTATDGRTQTFKIGSVKAYDGNIYARIDDENKIRLVSSSWDVILAKKLGDFRNKNLYRDPESKPSVVHRIEITQAGPELPKKFVFQREKEEWKMLEGPTDLPVSSSKVDGYLSLIKALRAQDFHAEDKSDLKKFHLSPPGVQVKLVAKGETFFTLEMSNPQERGDAYATSTDIKPIVSIFKVAAEPIYRKADSFFDKKIPFAFDVKEAAKLHIQTAALNGTFEKKDGAWVMTGKSLQKEPDGAKIESLIERIGQLEALRVFEAIGKAPPKFTSTITISRADGTTLLSLSWGPERIESRNSDQKPEAKYIVTRTNKIERVLGLSEKSLQTLDAANVFKEGSADVRSKD